MIRSFACADTQALFHSRPVSRFRNIERVARRRLLQIHAATELASLRVLAEKLYRRNPREWKKAGHASIEKALDRLLDPRTGWRVPDAAGRTGTDAILLSLQAEFEGDLVPLWQSNDPHRQQHEERRMDREARGPGGARAEDGEELSTDEVPCRRFVWFARRAFRPIRSPRIPATCCRRRDRHGARRVCHRNRCGGVEIWCGRRLQAHHSLH